MKKPDGMKFDINLRIRKFYLDKDLYLSNSFFFKEPKKFSSLAL